MLLIKSAVVFLDEQTGTRYYSEVLDEDSLSRLHTGLLSETLSYTQFSPYVT